MTEWTWSRRSIAMSGVESSIPSKTFNSPPCSAMNSRLSAANSMLIGRSRPVTTFDTSEPSGTALIGCDGTATSIEAASVTAGNSVYFSTISLPIQRLRPRRSAIQIGQNEGKNLRRSPLKFILPLVMLLGLMVALPAAQAEITLDIQVAGNDPEK